jgi:molecular chaperone GrpE
VTDYKQDDDLESQADVVAVEPVAVARDEGEAAQDVQLEEQAEAAEAEVEAKSELDLLREALEKTRAQSQEYLDGWQRARAELANARRRFERERAEAAQYANAELIRQLLPVSDDFERALAAVPDDVCEQAWLEGITIIQRNLQRVFGAAGVVPIDVQPGDTFDPALHEAITHEDARDCPSGGIIAEVRRGYKLGEAVLRPAMVRVAK